VEASSVTETCVADLHAYFNTDNVARALSAALLLLLDTWLSEHRCWSPVAVSCSKALLTSRKVSACPRTTPDSRSEAQRTASGQAGAIWRRLLPHAQELRERIRLGHAAPQRLATHGATPADAPQRLVAVTKRPSQFR